MTEFKCKHCGKVIQRESTKAWVKINCEVSAKRCHLMRVRSNDRR